mmetsp:Transcript_10792/g.25788  ORF Transcript_10792/g.25788 Transcript_10792/m.25788 type:complete len:209 (-) Transcript_10792:75-701(-)
MADTAPRSSNRPTTRTASRSSSSSRTATGADPRRCACRTCPRTATHASRRAPPTSSCEWCGTWRGGPTCPYTTARRPTRHARASRRTCPSSTQSRTSATTTTTTATTRPASTATSPRPPRPRTAATTGEADELAARRARLPLPTLARSGPVPRTDALFSAPPGSLRARARCRLRVRVGLAVAGGGLRAWAALLGCPRCAALGARLRPP